MFNSWTELVQSAACDTKPLKCLHLVTQGRQQDSVGYRIRQNLISFLGLAIDPTSAISVDIQDPSLAFTSTADILPANTERNKHVIIRSKRRFDVIIACLLHCVFAGFVSNSSSRVVLIEISPKFLWISTILPYIFDQMTPFKMTKWWNLTVFVCRQWFQIGL